MSIDGSGDAQDISNPTYGIRNGGDLLSTSSTTSDDAVMPERRKPTVQRTYGKRSGKTNRPSLTKAASDGSILSRSPSVSSTPAAASGNAAPSRKRGRQSDTTEAELGTAPKRKRSFVIVTIADTHKPIAKAPPKPKAKAAAPVRSTILHSEHHALSNFVVASGSRTKEAEGSSWSGEFGVGAVGKRWPRFAFI